MVIVRLRIITFTGILVLLQNAAVSAQEVELNGTVRSGNESLEAATVSLGNQSILTGKNGTFLFSVLPGTYTLVVTHSGHNKYEQQISVGTAPLPPLDIVLIPVGQLGEVVVLGSRSGLSRSNLNTTVPVDVFSLKTLRETGQVSLTQMLNFSAPSLNTSGETLNEPTTLRGLDPDHVLILLNGIRYHNMAWMNGGNLKGQLGRGSVGNDLNSIPPAAIEKVEVLRDGASAQYGSDAIAGVVNIILKGTPAEKSTQWQTGRFYKGDGEKVALGMSYGFALPNNKKAFPAGRQGFLTLSGDLRYQAPTHRGGQYEGTVYYNIPSNLSSAQQDSIKRADDLQVTERGFDRKAAVDQVGNSEFIVTGLFLNSSCPVTPNTDIIVATGINVRTVHRGQAFRFPKNPSLVNLELYPDGFQSLSKNITTDISLVAGAKGQLSKGMKWDISTSFGSNMLSSFLANANNASQSYLGKQAPTRFYNGRDIYQQLTTNATFVKAFSGLPSGINLLHLSTGFEYRIEAFNQQPGEEASWKNYDSTYTKQAGTGGTRPDDVIDKSRNNTGVFTELELELQHRLLIDIALRHEHYSDFGGNLAGKIAARYRFSNRLSLRSSVSNGFRAPSLQQRYTSSVTETFQNVGGVLYPSIRGIFPNDDPVVKALGVPSLTAEKSVNLSMGFTSRFAKHLTLTTDVYLIQLNNRIVLSGTFYRNRNPALEYVLSQHHEFDQVNQVAFFANAISTRTKGVDVVLEGNWNFYSSQLNLTLAANFGQTRLHGSIKTAENLPQDSINTNSLLNTEERTKIEHSRPSDKIILALNYKLKKATLRVTNTRFGKIMIAPLVDINRGIFMQESFSPKILTDIRVSYRMNPSLTLAIGSNNLFDVYPDKIQHYENTFQGVRIYSPESAPFGFNGGFYFINVDLTF